MARRKRTGTEVIVISSLFCVKLVDSNSSVDYFILTMAEMLIYLQLNLQSSTASLWTEESGRCKEV